MMKIFVIPSIFFFLQETFIENKKEIDKYFDIKTTIFPEKELSFCHKLKFFYCNIFATQCCRPLIFPTMNSVRLKVTCLKYEGFTPSSCK